MFLFSLSEVAATLKQSGSDSSKDETFKRPYPVDEMRGSLKRRRMIASRDSKAVEMGAAVVPAAVTTRGLAIPPVRRYDSVVLLPLAKRGVRQISEVPLPPNNSPVKLSANVGRRTRPYTRSSITSKVHGKYAEGFVKGDMLSRSLKQTICVYKRSIEPGGYATTADAGVFKVELESISRNKIKPPSEPLPEKESTPSSPGSRYQSETLTGLTDKTPTLAPLTDTELKKKLENVSL